MTNEQILKKATEKAIKNKWIIPDRGNTPWRVVTLGDDSVLLEYGDSYGMLELTVPEIIFSQDFAKAFFGEKDYWNEVNCTCGGVDFHLFGHDAHHLHCAKLKAERGYKFHLQKMVVEEDRLKYIEKFLDK